MLAKVLRPGLIGMLRACLGACASTAPPQVEPRSENERIGALAEAIAGLDDRIDPAEARDAARLAYRHSRQLARDYGITDSALIHNLKVNLGLRSRGLCVHWTRDLLDKLEQENFRSLDLHWAIANYERAFRIEHSSVVVSAVGASFDQGVVLDPWRHGGELFWVPTLEDTDYRWKSWDETMALKREVEGQNLDR